MKQFDVFSVRDFRNKSGELLRDAEAGRISLITKHEKPAILAVVLATPGIRPSKQRLAEAADRQAASTTRGSNRA